MSNLAGRLAKIADASKREDGTDIPLGEHLREAAARIESLEAESALWAQSSRVTFDAMVAMRNDINEVVPMPSLESDLLQGPENSVFCATVAAAVVQRVLALEAEVESLQKS